MRRERSFVFVFAILILSGMIGQIALKERELKGETIQTEKPEIEINGIMNGKIQKDWELYLAENLKIGTYLIPVKNEITYRFLQSSPNNHIVIGKGKELYEEAYIGFETQIYDAMQKSDVDDLVDKLKTIEELLKNKGKKLFVFITPSKAEIYPENIPDKYLAIAPKEKAVSTYQLFVEALQEKRIPFYDSIPDVRELKKSAEFRVFTKTGTHWSSVMAALCAKNLADSMERQIDLDLPEIDVTYKRCEQPTASDVDLYQLLNLMKKPEGEFYEPQIDMREPGGTDTIFLRGGSFMGSSVFRLIQMGFFKDSYFLSNAQITSSNNRYSGVFDSYDQLPISDMIADSDIVFLEVNEQVIGVMSFGFIDYLLDNNILE